jgi:hypothetical protein
MLTYTVISLNPPRHSPQPSIFCSHPPNPVPVSPLPAALTNSSFRNSFVLTLLQKPRGGMPSPRKHGTQNESRPRTRISRKELGARLLPKRPPETLVSTAYAAIACGNPLIMLILQFLSERRHTPRHTRAGARLRRRRVSWLRDHSRLSKVRVCRKT